MKNLSLLLILVISISISACGGGGDGDGGKTSGDGSSASIQDNNPAHRRRPRPPAKPPAKPPVKPPVKQITSILVNWNIPTTRVDGTPIALSEINGYKIYTSKNKKIIPTTPAATISDIFYN